MTALQFQTRLLNMQDYMMNFALMLTADKEDARDLLQDTTLKVLDNREKYIDNANFKGWVITIMRNIFINNYHRVVRSNTMMDHGADVYNLDSVNNSDYAKTDGAHDLKEINKAIESLSDEIRKPFALSLSGYQYIEIAEQMNIPLGTVKSRIFFARQQLQAKLKDFQYN